MSQNTVAFLIAIVGLIGVAVGVFISLTLTEFINNRDYHQRNKSIWNLLKVEVNHIITLSNENKIGNYLGPLRFTQKREEEDDHPESPAKLAREEDLVCAR